MLHKVKRRLYFVAATYFAFWAKFVLRRWKPQIIVVTGSSGKTTILHLIEAQLGDKAIYSHRANSSIGIPFHILGLGSNVLSRQQWIARIIAAPFAAWRRVPETKLYIVEADCDRPHEGQFLAKLLRPEAVLWVSIFRTHSAGFDSLIKKGLFKTHEEAIAYEFGHFIEKASKLVVINGDQPDMVKQLDRVRSGVIIKKAQKASILGYELEANDTIFHIDQTVVRVPGLHPPEAGVGLQMINALLEFLGQPLDPNYTGFRMPAGRSNLLRGIKKTTIIDSTYNTGLGATRAVLSLFKKYPAPKKWLVIGDILELGSLEQDEHEQLARLILEVPAEHIILIGPRTRKFTLPIIQKELSPKVSVVSFEGPKEVLDYLKEKLQGGETILFKGGRFLEGVIEELLADPKDAQRLVRREAVYVKRRQGWGLPK